MINQLVHLLYSCLAVFWDKFIVVDVARQRLVVYRRGYFYHVFDISTSVFGVGERMGSNQTPRGWFRIGECYGGECPDDTVFRARVASGQLSDFSDSKPEDPILARILRLEGLQSFNKNTYGRYIYIHGSPADAIQGQQKTSMGCVRMRPHDVIALFQMTHVGAWVYIVDEEAPLRMQPCFYDLTV